MTDSHYDPDTGYCQCTCPVCQPVGCSQRGTAALPPSPGCDNYLADGTPRRTPIHVTDTRGGRV